MSMIGLRANVREIADDPVLRFYGSALALIGPLTAVYWSTRPPLLREVIAAGTPSVCWPFFETCDALRRLAAPDVDHVLWLWSFVGIVAAGLFFVQRAVPLAFSLLVATTATGVLLILQDYRLLLNQHYMACCTMLAFLFLPGKRRTLPLLIVSFYFWAGTLKMNEDWISGAALYGFRPLGMPATLVPAACVYVIALELVVAFGVLARRPSVFWLSLGQLVLFHISSFWVVGFFYPLLMFLILAIFPLSRLMPNASPTVERSAHRLIRIGFLACFGVAQIVPRLFPGDPSITGEGRLFALHMFDAPVQCQATATFKAETTSPIVVAIVPVLVTRRLSCDPIVFFSIAREYCRHPELPSYQGDMDLALKSRKHTEDDFESVVDIRSFCAEQPHYSVWHHNSWINSGRAKP